MSQKLENMLLPGDMIFIEDNLYEVVWVISKSDKGLNIEFKHIDTSARLGIERKIAEKLL